MSDYFGALLRSAGAVPAAARALAPPAGEADVVEQDVEVDAGAAPASVVASRSPEASAIIEPTPDAPAQSTLQSLGVSTPQASAEPHEVGRREPAPSRIIRTAIDDEMHPAVRAALQWVRAKPAPAEATLPDVSEAPVAGDSPFGRPAAHVSTPRAPALPPPRALSVSRLEHSRERRQEHPLAMPSHDLDLALPPAPRGRPEGVATIDTGALQDRVEVTIGTIHVSVDAAPPARTVAQATPIPPRPQPSRPAERSGFARCRLPRI